MPTGVMTLGVMTCTLIKPISKIFYSLNSTHLYIIFVHIRDCFQACASIYFESSKKSTSCLPKENRTFFREEVNIK
ncbi:hypothetical protein ACLKA7_002512 [Drosophila subpalustris]